MKLNKSLESDSSRLPLFVPQFYLLMWKTLNVKWRNRLMNEERYKEHLAEFYSRQNNNHLEIYDDAFLEIRALLVQAAEIQAHEIVLDLASGAGYQANAFSASHPQVFASDCVFDRVKLAAELHAQQGVNWHVADAAHLPFAAKSFGVISMTAALHDMPTLARKQALGEVCRVVQRRAIFVEPIAPKNFILKLFFTLLLSIFDESMYMWNFLSSDIEAEFRAAGFKIVSKARCYHKIMIMFVCEPIDSSESRFSEAKYG